MLFCTDLTATLTECLRFVNTLASDCAQHTSHDIRSDMKKRKPTIGDVLLEYINGAGTTQSALAIKLNIHRSTLSCWIRGHRKPSRDQIPSVSAATGIPVERLL